MKITRLKRIRKMLNFYSLMFGFRPPYKVILDYHFIAAALEGHIDLKEQVVKMLQSETKIFVTRCVMNELSQLPKFWLGARLIAGKFPHMTCNHPGIISAHDCLLSLIGSNNPSHLIVAAQQIDFRERVRRVPGTPIIFMQFQVPIMEDISQASRTYSTRKEQKLSAPDEDEKKLLEEAKKEEAEEKKKLEEKNARPKRKKPQAPNPLSCKKKKTKPAPNQPKKKATDEEKKGEQKPSREESVEAAEAASDHSREPSLDAPDQQDGDEDHDDAEGGPAKKKRRTRRKPSKKRR
eukprot:TRINITY_DN4689_c0_g3_i1.p1 TRINITY_DN4689_c0_g3~~TRINITY_DN4689_c0_g3_i1.p1  ORF type:complete len:293 (+),score=55.58 TRINITY_DN4689_c0_g3_i1:73-951(+)